MRAGEHSQSTGTASERCGLHSAQLFESALFSALGFELLLFCLLLFAVTLFALLFILLLLSGCGGLIDKTHPLLFGGIKLALSEWVHILVGTTAATRTAVILIFIFLCALAVESETCIGGSCR